jgi:hypothetical protein
VRMYPSTHLPPPGVPCASHLGCDSRESHLQCLACLSSNILAQVHPVDAIRVGTPAHAAAAHMRGYGWMGRRAGGEGCQLQEYDICQAHTLLSTMLLTALCGHACVLQHWLAMEAREILDDQLSLLRVWCAGSMPVTAVMRKELSQPGSSPVGLVALASVDSCGVHQLVPAGQQDKRLGKGSDWRNAPQKIGSISQRAKQTRGLSLCSTAPVLNRGPQGRCAREVAYHPHPPPPTPDPPPPPVSLTLLCVRSASC